VSDFSKFEKSARRLGFDPVERDLVRFNNIVGMVYSITGDPEKMDGLFKIPSVTWAARELPEWF
jgi:hypothetical protein